MTSEGDFESARSLVNDHDSRLIARFLEVHGIGLVETRTASEYIINSRYPEACSCTLGIEIVITQVAALYPVELGTTFLPIRFDSPPEITFLTLRSAAAAPLPI
jgi:hypothetical protein